MANESTLLSKLNEKSDTYDRLLPKWRKTNIIYKGEDSVHLAGELLLPRLQQQDDDMYRAYVERARFLNAFKRTVSGLIGTVKRKQPDSDLSLIEEYEDNIDLKGNSVKDYFDKVLNEVIKIGVCATLVDYNDSSDDDELTIAQVEELNLRPKFCFYQSKSIYRVRYGIIKGVSKIILVVLNETYIKKENEFEYEELEQFRVLRINDDGFYEQQLYRVEESGAIEIMDAIVPEINGQPMDEIPFYIHGEWKEPPLYDLVTNNIKHYQLQADLNHALHYIGLPTPYRIGVDINQKGLPTAIGPSTIWDIENENAEVGYLEFEGKGLDNITKELETIKEEMAFLGASILVSDQMVNETATKANLRNASETSSLADLVMIVSETATEALEKFAEWIEREGDIFYRFNTDFDINKLTAQDILARVQSWQSGAFSKQSLYKQLKDGEVELASDTYEEEESMISSQI